MLVVADDTDRVSPIDGAGSASGALRMTGHFVPGVQGADRTIRQITVTLSSMSRYRRL